MDEILVANFMVFQEVVEEGHYDLVIGDEAWVGQALIDKVVAAYRWPRRPCPSCG